MFFKIGALKNSQYSQENTLVGVFFNNVASLQAKKRLQQRMLQNFQKIFFTEHIQCLLLNHAGITRKKLPLLVSIDSKGGC